jgi:eukaryotic-like serine/threonine-protein kinase
MLRHALVWVLLLAVAGCSALTDFSPLDSGVLEDRYRPDDGGTDDAREAGLTCHTGPDTCPSGMVYVPCGQVVIGSDSGEGDEDEMPKHVVSISALCIDLREVTNRDYGDCVSASECEPPRAVASHTRPSYYGNATYDGYPVLSVDWDQARIYCAWRGKRLPTEAEWEKAARGGCETTSPSGCGTEDEKIYPWGDATPTCDLANSVGCVTDTEPVGARPAGASVYGAQDMAGNVQEWVSDWYASNYYSVCAAGDCIDPPGPATGSEKVFRGGAWESTETYLRNANRFRQVPGYADEHLGFRCAAPLIDP